MTDWLTDKVSYVECSFVRDIFTNKISSLSYIAAEEFRVTDGRKNKIKYRLASLLETEFIYSDGCYDPYLELVFVFLKTIKPWYVIDNFRFEVQFSKYSLWLTDICAPIKLWHIR